MNTTKPSMRSEEMMGVFSPDNETQHVVDRGPEGIAATVMQREEKMTNGNQLTIPVMSRQKLKKNFAYRRREPSNLLRHSNKQNVFCMVFLLLL